MVQVRIVRLLTYVKIHLVAAVLLLGLQLPGITAPAKTSSSSSSKSSNSKSSGSSKSSSSSKSSGSSTSKASSTAKKSSSSSSSKSSKPTASSSDDSSPRSSGPDKDDEDESGSSSSTAADKPTTTSAENLPKLVDAIVSAASKAAHWGVLISNPITGQALYERNANEAFIPASNRKIFTGALALDQLGPDFRFRTFLYHTGNVGGDGTLNGNLVIIPSGDPTFSRELYSSTSSDWVYRDWAQKVADSGIKDVSGDLLIDCSAWDLTDLSPRGWPDRMLQHGYAPQTSPLTLNSNLITVIVNPTKNEEPGKISFAPPATGYPVQNQTKTGKSGRVSVRRTQTGLVASGTVSKAGQGGQIPCDNPTLFAAANFRHHLREKGIHVQGAVRIVGSRANLPGWNNDNLIAMVESLPMLDIVKHMMKKSDNHMAEQIYVAVSAHKLGQGSYNNSKRLEADLLSRAGIDPRSVRAYDGCGLSESNKVSPAQVCKLLNYMLTHPQAQNFYDSMAIGGVDGTLRNRMKTEQLKAKVHAKTGTINRVSTLSGYFRLSEQQLITFSFLVNRIPQGASVRGSQDRIISVLASLVL